MDGNTTKMEGEIGELGEFSNLIVIENQAGSTDSAKMVMADVEKIVLATEHNAKTVLVLVDLFFEGISQSIFNFAADFYAVDSAGNLIYENAGKIVARYDFATGDIWELSDGHYMGRIVSHESGEAVYTTEKGNIIIGVHDNRLVAVVPRPDFAARWEVYSLLIAPYVENIMGVILMDEPYFRAIQQGTPLWEIIENLNQMIALVKETFPTIKTIGIFSALFSELDHEYFHGVPIPENATEKFWFPNFDIVGFDFYFSANPGMPLGKFKTLWTRKFNLFRKLLQPGQEIVLVSGTFYFGDTDPPTVEEFLDLADFYSKIARYNSRVTAIMPFLWESAISLGLVGMQYLPEEVLSRWQEIGGEISRP